ncbi:phosphoserine phosphatase SerB [Actinomycetaceae bacterium L2_0104]
MTLFLREGEPVRFSLAALSPLPAGLLTHTRHVFSQEFDSVVESTPQVPDIHTLSFSGRSKRAGDIQEVMDELRGPALALKVDCALLTGDIAVDGPRMIVSDVDSTFIRDEVIEMIAAAADVEELVRDITDQAMHGTIEFGESLRQRVAAVRGVSTQMFADVASRVTVTPGARELIAAVHDRGGFFGLVSGGFHEVVDLFAEPLNVDGILANRFEIAEGTLTGKTLGPVIDRQAKARTLREWANAEAIPLELTAAMGDGANDLDMMKIAGLSVAFCAKPIVIAQADAIITVARFDILIALLGWDAPNI